MRTGILVALGVVGALAGAWCAAAQVRSHRVVLRAPGMDSVPVQKDLTYEAADGARLPFYVYTPPDLANGERAPVVVFVNVGDPPQGPPARDWGQYTDWPRLAALEGLASVTYAARRDSALADGAALIKHLRTNGAELGVDTDVMAVWACSANVRVGMALATDPSHGFIRAAVMYYGSAPAGTPIRGDMPLLLVSAGMDGPIRNASFGDYARRALEETAPVTLVSAAGASHAFDLFDDNDYSRALIRDTLSFLRTNLSPEVRAAYAETAERRAQMTALLDADRLFQQERWLDAAALYARAVEEGIGGLGVSMQRLAQCYYNAEEWEKAADAYEAMQRFPGHRATALYNAACSAALGGDTERALDLLARAFEAGFSNRDLARTDSDLDSIRGDARFGEIVGE